MCSVQLLTPPGRSAVATIALSGEGSLDVLATHFQRINGRPLSKLPLHAVTYGTWNTLGEQPDSPSGEGVVVARTTSDCVEVHCHGGTLAAERILADLTASGCQRIEVSPQVSPEGGGSHENSKRVVTIEDEARWSLAQSLTERTAVILLDQLNGAIRDACNTIVSSMDHGQRDIALQGIRALLATYRVGRHLTRPWQVVLAGPANVGKSSLINALVGYQRAIVFNQPGTTRDVVTAITAINGWPVELADTAGIRESNSPIEADGIHRAQDRFRNADIAVLVMEATSATSTDGRQVPPDVERLKVRLQQLRPDAILVFNKCDLVNESEEWNRPEGQGEKPPHGHGPVVTSATEQIGIDELLGAIGDAIETDESGDSEQRGDSERSLIGKAMLFTDRQKQLVQNALLSLESTNSDEAKYHLLQLQGCHR